jgi:predicted transcriptional regulator
MSVNAYLNEIEPDDEKLLGRLEQKPYQAYSIPDLLPKVENKAYLAAMTVTLTAQLNRLIDKGLVQSKNIGGITYYISVKAIS